MDQFDVARLDENGTIIAIDVVCEKDYVTDPFNRTVKLEPSHDMRNRIGNYRYDWLKHTFIPLSTEPIDAAERDTSELVEGLVETIEDISDYLGKPRQQRRNLGGSRVADDSFALPLRMQRVLKEYRRNKPRKKDIGE